MRSASTSAHRLLGVKQRSLPSQKFSAGVKKLTVINDGFKIALDDRLAAHKLIAEATGLLGKERRPVPTAIAASQPVSKAHFELGRVDIDKLSEEQLRTVYGILELALVKEDE